MSRVAARAAALDSSSASTAATAVGSARVAALANSSAAVAAAAVRSTIGTDVSEVLDEELLLLLVGTIIDVVD